MALLTKRNFVTWSAIFVLCLYLTDALETTTLAESDEDDSSSEETIEDSNEGARRKRHAPPPVTTDTISAGDQRAGIPGLPDPATILRIADILQTVGEKVIPILVQGNAFATERIGQEFQFLNKFKKDIEQFTQRTVGINLKSSNNNSSST